MQSCVIIRPIYRFLLYTDLYTDIFILGKHLLCTRTRINFANIDVEAQPFTFSSISKTRHIWQLQTCIVCYIDCKQDVKVVILLLKPLSLKALILSKVAIFWLVLNLFSCFSLITMSIYVPKKPYAIDHYLNTQSMLL